MGNPSVGATGTIVTAIDGLVCTRCGRQYSADEPLDTCGDHDGTDGLLDVTYDDERVAAVLAGDDAVPSNSLWRYEPILPTRGQRVSLGAGGTPLLEAPTLSDALDVRLRLKDEATNPTGSMKDRTSAVMASRGAASADVLACASTGNAAASLAAYAARAGLDCHIFVPTDVPEGKAVQPRIHGAAVTTVDGTYDDAFERCQSRSSAAGWLDCSAAVNPYGLEGLRTVGFEIAEQVAEDPPDWVVVPMGNGCGIAGIWKGLASSFRHGVLDAAPAMLGVQAAGAAPIHERFTGEAGGTTGTDADSIDVGFPHNGDRAIDALRASGGRSVVVDDDEIMAAEAELARREGTYVEPASAATLAGLRQARREGIVSADDDVTLVLTGSGLKDTQSARRLVDGLDADSDE